VVTLASNLDAATVPASVTVAANATTATFAITTRAVAAVIEDPHAAMFSFTPALDIRSAQQAQLRTRLFQS